MTTEGPPLAALTRRLAACPPEFLAEPRIGAIGVIHVDAVVADLIRRLGGPGIGVAAAAAFRSADSQEDRNRLALVLIAVWLFEDPWFRGSQWWRPAFAFLRGADLRKLATLEPAPRFVADDDRREELARLALAALELRPAGETAAQAQDLLTTVSSVERRRVVTAARAAEERAAKIREAMRQRRAAAGPARYSRE